MVVDAILSNEAKLSLILNIQKQSKQDQLSKLVEQHNQTTEQITMLQSSLGDLRLQISKQQGIIEALESIEKGKKDAKT